MTEKLTWRDVFDSTKPFGAGSRIQDLLFFLRSTGYHYFIWNGRVYEEIQGYSDYKFTGLNEDDLKDNHE